MKNFVAICEDSQDVFYFGEDVEETLTTPAGRFAHCLKTREGTALDPSEKEFKTYAPGIGLIQDGMLLLTGHGFSIAGAGRQDRPPVQK